jgi:hypothetical protein
MTGGITGGRSVKSLIAAVFGAAGTVAGAEREDTAFVCGRVKALFPTSACFCMRTTAYHIQLDAICHTITLEKKWLTSSHTSLRGIILIHNMLQEKSSLITL